MEQAVETLWLSYLPEEIVQTSGTGNFDDTLIARGGEISTVPFAGLVSLLRMRTPTEVVGYFQRSAEGGLRRSPVGSGGSAG